MHKFMVTAQTHKYAHYFRSINEQTHIFRLELAFDLKRMAFSKSLKCLLWFSAHFAISYLTALQLGHVVQSFILI